MSLHEYLESQEIDKHNYQFYALLMALIRKADTNNLSKLTLMWPDTVAEFRARYNAPGGVLILEEDHEV